MLLSYDVCGYDDGLGGTLIYGYWSMGVFVFACGLWWCMWWLPDKRTLAPPPATRVEHGDHKRHTQRWTKPAFSLYPYVHNASMYVVMYLLTALYILAESITLVEEK